MDVKYFVSDHHKCTRELQNGSLTLNLTLFHTFSVYSQNTFFSADLSIVYTCSFDSNMF